MQLKLFIISGLMFSTACYIFYSKKFITTFISKNNQSIELIKEIPQNFVLETLQDQEVILNNLTLNSFSIVHFWGTWCGPCAHEFPELVKLISNLNSENWKSFLIAVNDEKVAIKKFISKFSNIDSLIFLENNNAHQINFQVYKVPETLVFDKKGKLIKRFTGAQDWNSPYIKSFFESIK